MLKIRYFGYIMRIIRILEKDTTLGITEDSRGVGTGTFVRGESTTSDVLKIHYLTTLPGKPHVKF